jgi:hypothetical protein
MSAQDLWDKLDALPWPAPWAAHTFEIDCPCPNGDHCGDTHDCAEVEAREAYPSSPEEPASPGRGQCVVQISTPGLETFSRPCAEFIAAARNELPAIRKRCAALEAVAVAAASARSKFGDDYPGRFAMLDELLDALDATREPIASLP